MASKAGQDLQQPLLPTKGDDAELQSDFKVCGFDTHLTNATVQRATMLMTTALQVSSMFTLSVVMYTNEQDNPPQSGITLMLFLNTFLPQLLMFGFLHYNKEIASWKVALLRITVCPFVACIFLGVVGIRSQHSRIGFFGLCFSLEPIYEFAQSWRTCKQSVAHLWYGVGAGLISAPGSVVLTLYPQMIKRISPTPLFLGSACISIASVAYSASTLGTMGRKTSSVNLLWDMLTKRLPVVLTRVFGLTFFAFATRPVLHHATPGSEEDLKHNRAFVFTAWLCVLVATNFSFLKLISLHVRFEVAAMLSFVMTMVGPPTLLPSLRKAQGPDAIFQIAMIFLAIMIAYRMNNAGQLQFLLDQWTAPVVIWALALCFAVYAKSKFLLNPGKFEEVHDEVNSMLEHSAFEEDRTMCGLICNVEDPDVRKIAMHSLDHPDANYSIGKWSGVAASATNFVFSPFSDNRLFAMDKDSFSMKTWNINLKTRFLVQLTQSPGKARTHHDANPVSGIERSSLQLTEMVIICEGGKRMRAKEALLEHDPAMVTGFPREDLTMEGALVSCETDLLSAEEINSVEISLKATTDGSTGFECSGLELRQAGSASESPLFNHKFSSTEIEKMKSGDSLTIEVHMNSDALKENWNGIVCCDRHFLCAPFNAHQVLVAVEQGDGTLKVEYLDLDLPAGMPLLRKWVGGAAVGHKVFFCPYDATQLLVVDTQSRGIKFVDLPMSVAFEQEKWSGAEAVDGQIYFCPYNASHILKVNADTLQMDLLPLPDNLDGALCPAKQDMDSEGHKKKPKQKDQKHKDGKWWGVAAVGKQLYFAPYDAQSILTLDTSTGKQQLHQVPSDFISDKRKFAGVTASNSRVLFVPFNAREALIVHPSQEPSDELCMEVVVLDYDTKSLPSKWMGAAVYDHHFVLAPYHSAEHVFMMKDVFSKLLDLDVDLPTIHYGAPTGQHVHYSSDLAKQQGSAHGDKRGGPQSSEDRFALPEFRREGGKEEEDAPITSVLEVLAPTGDNKGEQEPSQEAPVKMDKEREAALAASDDHV